MFATTLVHMLMMARVMMVVQVLLTAYAIVELTVLIAESARNELVLPYLVLTATRAKFSS